MEIPIKHIKQSKVSPVHKRNKESWTFDRRTLKDSQPLLLINDNTDDIDPVIGYDIVKTGPESPLVPMTTQSLHSAFSQRMSVGNSAKKIPVYSSNIKCPSTTDDNCRIPVQNSAAPRKSPARERFGYHNSGLDAKGGSTDKNSSEHSDVARTFDPVSRNTSFKELRTNVSSQGRDSFRATKTPICGNDNSTSEGSPKRGSTSIPISNRRSPSPRPLVFLKNGASSEKTSIRQPASPSRSISSPNGQRSPKKESKYTYYIVRQGSTSPTRKRASSPIKANGKSVSSRENSPKGQARSYTVDRKTPSPKKESNRIEYRGKKVSKLPSAVDGGKKVGLSPGKSPDGNSVRSGSTCTKGDLECTDDSKNSVESTTVPIPVVTSPGKKGKSPTESTGGLSRIRAMFSRGSYSIKTKDTNKDALDKLSKIPSTWNNASSSPVRNPDESSNCQNSEVSSKASLSVDNMKNISTPENHSAATKSSFSSGNLQNVDTQEVTMQKASYTRTEGADSETKQTPGVKEMANELNNRDRESKLPGLVKLKQERAKFFGQLPNRDLGSGSLKSKESESVKGTERQQQSSNFGFLRNKSATSGYTPLKFGDYQSGSKTLQTSPVYDSPYRGKDNTTFSPARTLQPGIQSPVNSPGTYTPNKIPTGLSNIRTTFGKSPEKNDSHVANRSSTYIGSKGLSGIQTTYSKTHQPGNPLSGATSLPQYSGLKSPVYGIKSPVNSITSPGKSPSSQGSGTPSQVRSPLSNLKSPDTKESSPFHAYYKLWEERLAPIRPKNYGKKENKNKNFEIDRNIKSPVMSPTQQLDKKFDPDALKKKILTLYMVGSSCYCYV